MDRHDRRDLACLGLMVLVYGLALAPVLHVAVGHGHGHRHAHARVHAPDDVTLKAAGHEHPVGSVEHLLALAVAKVHVWAPTVWWVPLRWDVLPGPLRLPGATPRLTAMPQGP